MRWFVALALLAAPACQSGASPTEALAAEASAKAKAEEEAVAKRKAEREAKQAAQRQEEEKRVARIDALAVLPAKLPKKLEKACNAMVSAYDRYMRTVLTGDMLTKWETGGNEMQIKVFRKECSKGSVEVAACQAHALGKATPELERQLPDIMGRCKEKFGR